MQGKEKIEFYLNDKLLATVESTMVPTVESMISIRAITYEVISVTYALDNADEQCGIKRMRANIDLRAV